MDDKSQAELEILVAADRWARDVMRQDKALSPAEQKLFETIIYYQRLTKSLVDIPPPEFPKPPPLPRKELESYIETTTEHPTHRYSDVPTVPSPAKGIPAVRSDIEDGDPED